MHSPKSSHEHFRSSPMLPLPEVLEVGLGYDEESGRTVISLTNESDYPAPDNLPESVTDLLLDRTMNNDLLVPTNYITLGQALNNAAGARNDRGIKVAEDLFTELADSLSAAARDNYVPAKISYANVVYSREKEGVKLLPPLQMIKFADEFQDQAKAHVEAQLIESLQEGAVNEDQMRLLVGTYASFINNFDW